MRKRSKEKYIEDRKDNILEKILIPDILSRNFYRLHDFFLEHKELITNDILIAVVNKSAQIGRIEIIQWFHDTNNIGITSAAIDISIAYKKNHCVHWFYKNGYTSPNALNIAKIYNNDCLITWLCKYI